MATIQTHKKKQRQATPKTQNNRHMSKAYPLTVKTYDPEIQSIKKVKNQKLPLPH